MNPANDNTELEEQNIVAARSIINEPVLGSELKEILPTIPLPQDVESIEHAIQTYGGLTGKQIAEGYMLAGLPIPTAREWVNRDFSDETRAFQAYYVKYSTEIPRAFDGKETGFGKFCRKVGVPDGFKIYRRTDAQANSVITLNEKVMGFEDA